ncbi:MAG: ABC transporter substrate-binding protein [Candidatus Bathyarchaeia archaeon]
MAKFGKIEAALIVAIIALILSIASLAYTFSVLAPLAALPADISKLSGDISGIKGDISSLRGRVSSLEEAVKGLTPTPPTPPTPPPPPPLLEGCELRVGIILPLTGAMAAFGQSGLRGAEMATEEINAAGGILGAKIKLFIEDFGGDPKVAVSATEKVITVNKVHVIRGYFTSSGAMSAMPTAEKYRTPCLSIGSSAKELCEQGWKYWFKTPPNSTMFNIVATEFLSKVIEPKLKLGRPLKVAVLHENTLMGVSDKDEFLKQVSAKGLKWEIVAVEAYTAGALDFKPILEKLKGLAPDVVAASGYLTDTVLIAKQSLEIGFTPIWISIGGAGMQTPELIRLAGEAVKYWFVANEYWYDRAYPNAEAGRKVSEKFMERYGVPHDFQSWAGYAGMYMLKEVIEKMAEKYPDRVKNAFVKDDVGEIREIIREGLATLKIWIDWLGELYFEPNGQLAYSITGPAMGCTILQVQPAKPGDLWSHEGLTFHTVYSPVYATADPIIPPK